MKTKTLDDLIVHIPALESKYPRGGEDNINPGFVNLADARSQLGLNDKRIWVLTSDFRLITGVKNTTGKGYENVKLEGNFDPEVHKFLNKDNYGGHPTLALSMTEKEGLVYNGGVLYAGWVAQRGNYLEFFMSSGRYNRNDLDEKDTHLLNIVVASRFAAAYGDQTCYFIQYDPKQEKQFFDFLNDRQISGKPKVFTYYKTLFPKLEQARVEGKLSEKCVLQTLSQDFHEHKEQKKTRIKAGFFNKEQAGTKRKREETHENTENKAKRTRR